MEAQLLNIELPILGSGTNPRSEGLHLTDIIKSLMRKSGIEPGKLNWDQRTVFTAGFIWEEVLDSLWADVFSKALARLLARAYDWYFTGEISLNGITGTPDGLDVNREWTLQEAKFTWRGVKNKPEDNWYYMTQLKSYCKMLRINKALLHVFFCNGDWRGSGPIYQPWLFTFKQHELEENWAMILNHANYMRSNNGLNS